MSIYKGRTMLHFWLTVHAASNNKVKWGFFLRMNSMSGISLILTRWVAVVAPVSVIYVKLSILSPNFFFLKRWNYQSSHDKRVQLNNFTFSLGSTVGSEEWFGNKFRQKHCKVNIFTEKEKNSSRYYAVMIFALLGNSGQFGFFIWMLNHPVFLSKSCFLSHSQKEVYLDV